MISKPIQSLLKFAQERMDDVEGYTPMSQSVDAESLHFRISRISRIISGLKSDTKDEYIEDLIHIEDMLKNLANDIRKEILSFEGKNYKR